MHRTTDPLCTLVARSSYTRIWRKKICFRLVHLSVLRQEKQNKLEAHKKYGCGPRRKHRNLDSKKQIFISCIIFISVSSLNIYAIFLFTLSICTDLVTWINTLGDRMKFMCEIFHHIRWPFESGIYSLHLAPQPKSRKEFTSTTTWKAFGRVCPAWKNKLKLKRLCWYLYIYNSAHNAQTGNWMKIGRPAS